MPQSGLRDRLIKMLVIALVVGVVVGIVVFVLGLVSGGEKISTADLTEEKLEGITILRPSSWEPIDPGSDNLAAFSTEADVDYETAGSVILISKEFYIDYDFAKRGSSDKARDVEELKKINSTSSKLSKLGCEDASEISIQQAEIEGADVSFIGSAVCVGLNENATPRIEYSVVLKGGDEYTISIKAPEGVINGNREAVNALLNTVKFGN